MNQHVGRLATRIDVWLSLKQFLDHTGLRNFHLYMAYKTKSYKHATFHQCEVNLDMISQNLS